MLSDLFAVEMEDGTVFTFTDPRKVRWTELTGHVDLTKPGQTLSLFLGEEMYAALSQRNDVDGYFLAEVFVRYVEHYGLN